MTHVYLAVGQHEIEPGGDNEHEEHRKDKSEQKGDQVQVPQPGEKTGQRFNDPRNKFFLFTPREARQGNRKFY